MDGNEHRDEPEKTHGTRAIEELMLVAKQAAAESGELLKHYLHNGVEIRSKEASSGGATYDLVSDADLEAEQCIARILRRAYPEHELLGEETLQGSLHADHLWIIDPLDGTNNFAHRIPHFAVSIAYLYRGEAQLGVVYNPAREEWFTVIRGRGAFHNGQRVAVSSAQGLEQTIIGCGFYYDRGEMMRGTLETIADLFGKHIHGIRRFGAASIDLCYVGCGYFGGFFEYKLSPWDFAAGGLFVEEAGGQITDALGVPLRIAKTSVVASNRLLHPSLLEITERHYQSRWNP